MLAEQLGTDRWVQVLPTQQRALADSFESVRNADGRHSPGLIAWEQRDPVLIGSQLFVLQSDGIPY